MNSVPRAIAPDELRKCLYALKAILKAHDQGILTPAPLQEGAEALTLTILGDALNPEVSSDRRLYEGVAQSNVVALPNIPNDFPNLPRLSARWLIGFPEIPVRIQGDDRTVRSVMVVDEETELILSGVPLQGGVPEALEAVYETFRGHGMVKRPGLPREALIANRELFAALQPVLRALGVQCSHEPRIFILDRIRSRPKSWWKLSIGATLSCSSIRASCYAASKYLSLLQNPLPSPREVG